MRIRPFLVTTAAFVCFTLIALASVPTTTNDFLLPGSQPLQSGDIKKPTDCDCHGGYDEAVEPVFNWQGSMMAQASRDPLLYAAMAIANQDAPESGELCIRCHTPKAWLEGRSTPTDGSALTQDDRDGVLCHFCHKLIEPTAIGVNPHPGDQTYTDNTYPADQTYLGTITDIPSHPANGMYVVDENDVRRGPYTDASPPHEFYYSPFHRDAALCGTCHDVSNPVYSRDGATDNYVPNTFDQPAPDFSPYAQFPVERTYSEWLHSDYNSAAGVYAPQFGGNLDTVRTCQDCHMRDVTGKGAQQGSAPTRTDLALHDMTGGNTFIPAIVAALYPDEVDAAALDSGVQRATAMLEKAASLNLASGQQGANHLVTVTVTNETGHKLLSGYPEGRRMWLSVNAYDGGDILVYESGAYDTATAILTADADAKIYEIKPGISGSLSPTVGIAAGPSFHFVLNDTIYKDNRIPPRGFVNATYEAIQSQPVAYSYADGQFWDDTDYPIPGNAEKVVVTLYYQTASKEYVEFLRDENVTDSSGLLLYNMWVANGKSTPVAMVQDSISLSPLGGNQPPILAQTENQAVAEAQPLDYAVQATDPNGDPLTLTTSSLPAGATFVDSTNGVGVLTWTPTYDQAGTYPISFFATDTAGAADTATIDVVVSNVNRAPLWSTVDPYVADPGVELAFDITAADPDGESLTLAPISIPATASFTDHHTDTGSFSWTPVVADTGAHLLVFSASDGLLTDSLEVLVSVRSPSSCCINRGDMNSSGTYNLTDITLLVNYLFLGGVAPDCVDHADVTGDGTTNLTDLTVLVNFMFLGGAPPAPC